MVPDCAAVGPEFNFIRFWVGCWLIWVRSLARREAVGSWAVGEMTSQDSTRVFAVVASGG